MDNSKHTVARKNANEALTERDHSQVSSFKVPLQALADLAVSIVAQIRIVMEVLAAPTLLLLSAVGCRVIATVATVVAEAVALADGGCGRGVERVHLDHVSTRSS